MASRASPEAHVSDGLVTPVSDKVEGGDCSLTFIYVQWYTSIHKHAYTYLHIHPHVHTEIKNR